MFGIVMRFLLAPYRLAFSAQLWGATAALAGAATSFVIDDTALYGEVAPHRLDPATAALVRHLVFTYGPIPVGILLMARFVPIFGIAMREMSIDLLIVLASTLAVWLNHGAAGLGIYAFLALVVGAALAAVANIAMIFDLSHPVLPLTAVLMAGLIYITWARSHDPARPAPAHHHPTAQMTSSATPTARPTRSSASTPSQHHPTLQRTPSATPTRRPSPSSASTSASSSARTSPAGHR